MFLSMAECPMDRLRGYDIMKYVRAVEEWRITSRSRSKRKSLIFLEQAVA